MATVELIGSANASGELPMGVAEAMAAYAQIEKVIARHPFYHGAAPPSFTMASSTTE